MKLFYINEKNVMGRDCTIDVADCPIVEYMRNAEFTVKFDAEKIFFTKPYKLSDLERGMHVVNMHSTCANCKKSRMRELMHDRTK